ncbi:MAG: hypothetical protein DRR16_27130 [Candidatus Parabeggiatoa sp. nov. 3]|nr:MAG: hypothetical protein DRR00_10170 [Gammaproteobacteria bacterium]RKZ68473.1 MAG: hypothetical protein DRQ99_03625 [Gammaproteobacteria bacterium]RKZ78712.1 MAG: hypothetical protein DRR16_27130 [Gammaproteobacteria bacterium]
MANKNPLVNPDSAIRNTKQNQYVDDLVVEMTGQAYMDGASHEEVGELQQQIKNGTYRRGDWDRKVASWYD